MFSWVDLDSDLGRIRDVQYGRIRDVWKENSFSGILCVGECVH